MQSRVFLLTRRVALLFGVLLVLGLLGGCNSDSKSDGSHSGGSGSDAEIALTYNGKSIQANTSVSVVNPMFIGAMKTFSVTIMGGWNDAKSDPTFGLITTRLTLMGDSETAVPTGSYTLEKSTSGPIGMSGPMSATLVIEDPELGLPKSLVATAGTLTVDSIDSGEKSLEQIKLNFDGTFQNSADTSDTTEYKLTGSINVSAK